MTGPPLESDEPTPVDTGDGREPPLGSAEHYARLRAAEATLVAQARSGDRDAFEVLVSESFDGLVRFCGSLAGRDGALDLAQEAVLKALRAMPRFRGEARFRSWLYRIARNTHLNERARLRTKKERSDTDSLDLKPGRSEAPDRGLYREELRRRLDAAIATLPEAQRTALLLCDRDELAYKEIADVMGTPIGTVMSRIYYARSKLRELLGDLIGG